MDSEVLSAGEIIRKARMAASLSQSELARRAGVAQRVVSAYEADRRSPSWEMLKKLVAASGSHLDLTITPIPGAPRGLPSTEMGQRIRQHRRAILAAAQKY
jgi:transcriptional regulator with XRE-family HTH domain